jgi:hypothetical protein
MAAFLELRLVVLLHHSRAGFQLWPVLDVQTLLFYQVFLEKVQFLPDIGELSPEVKPIEVCQKGLKQTKYNCLL